MTFITPTEKLQLEAQLKKTKDLSQWKRIFSVLAYDEGKSVDEIAETLRISVFTVEDYLKEYRSKNKTKNDPRGGGSSKLNDALSEELKQHLFKNTYLKVKSIIAYVSEKYGVKYSRSGMTAWLNQHGFTFKRPQKVPGKVDPQEQQRFIEKYQKIKDFLKPEEEIYFIDAVHPEHQSQAVCGWIRKGEQKTLQTSGKQLRLHFAGALCLNGMKIITSEYETVNADAMLDFFKKIENTSAAKTIHIIMDNARANKNKKTEEFLKNSRIKAHYLPPYSPNLNPIERLWKVMREVKIYNRYYASCKDFFSEVRRFFSEEIPNMIGILQKRINDKFQIIRLNPIVMV
jgi:transposase